MNHLISKMVILALGLAFTSPAQSLANESLAKTETCKASWYGPGLQGNDMANGDTFDMNDITVVAHKTLPFGTVLIVTNLNNGAVLAVEVQDRGPHVKGRCVDLSRAGSKALGFYCGPKCGTAPVSVTICRRQCPKPGTLLREPEKDLTS